MIFTVFLRYMKMMKQKFQVMAVVRKLKVRKQISQIKWKRLKMPLTERWERVKLFRSVHLLS